jgi:hypothetical protein
LKPTRWWIGPLIIPPTAIIINIGRMMRPATVTDEPKPYPAELGVSMNCGRNVSTENMEAPKRSATRLVVQTAV